MEIYQKTPSKIGAMYVFTVKAREHSQGPVFQSALFISDIAKSIDAKSDTLIYDMRFRTSPGSSQGTKKYVRNRKSRYSKQISKGLYAGSDFSNFIPRTPQTLATVRSIYSGLNKMDGSKAKYNHKKIVTVKALLKKHFPHQLKGLAKKQPVIKPVKAYKHSKQLNLNTGEVMQDAVNKGTKPFLTVRLKKAVRNLRSKLSAQEIEINSLMNDKIRCDNRISSISKYQYNEINRYKRKVLKLSDTVDTVRQRNSHILAVVNGYKQSHKNNLKRLNECIKSENEIKNALMKHPIKARLLGLE